MKKSNKITNMTTISEKYLPPYVFTTPIQRLSLLTKVTSCICVQNGRVCNNETVYTHRLGFHDQYAQFIAMNILKDFASKPQVTDLEIGQREKYGHMQKLKNGLI